MTELNRPVVVFSSVEWDFTWQRHQAMAFELAKIAPLVVFVESLPKRIPHIKEASRIIQRLKRAYQSDAAHKKVKQARPDNLSIVPPLALPATNAVFEALNRLIFVPPLARKIRRIVGQSPYIVNYSPTQTAIDLCARLQPTYLIYDYVDRWAADFRSPRRILASHQSLLERADLITTPSEFLMQEVQASCSTPVKVIPHGVDFELFNVLDSAIPDDRIKKVGYFGSIGEYLDYEILEEIAREFELVLVGPRRTHLPDFQHVTYRPFVPHREIIGQIQDCDAFILPYKNDEYGLGVNPIKLLECFATGRVVMGTPIPALERYREIMQIVSTPQEAVERLTNIQQYESGLMKAQRLELARSSSWRQMAQMLVAQISAQ